MQLSIIRRMSEKRKKAWLDAIDRLEKDYRTSQQDYLDCPLCRVPKECEGCLWPIIEGCGCTEYIWGDGYVGVPQRWDGNYGEWRTHRLNMLQRWRLIIKFSQKDFINRFGATIEEVKKAFEALGKGLVKDFRPLGKMIKNINEAIEKAKKEEK